MNKTALGFVFGIAIVIAGAVGFMFAKSIAEPSKPAINAPAPVQTAAPAAQGSPPAGQTPSLTVDEQIETIKKLKELMDAGILSSDEFEAKKKQVMGL